MDPVNVPAKFEVPEIIAGTLKLWTVPRSSKVVDFGTNRKRVCDFLLVRNGNLGHILHRFGDIAVFVLLSDPTPISP